ncbi:type II secretion system F family protein [candidate division KSB1 bacterium]|nr:type II secretion system F family protein [candidate division KSB1 bacterium]
MPEYRYLGVNVAGKPIQGILFGTDSKAIKNRIKKIVDKKGFRLDAVQKKTRFTYKVQKGGEKPIKGEQKAFAKEELENALMKMGYRVHYVRKKWFSINFGIPNKDLVLFIRICADLLREKFPYDEILTLTAEDTENKRLRETIREIQKDLKAGNDGHEVYGKHQDVLGKFTAHMLAVASTSGNMAAMYESTAKFLERYEEFKRNLRSVLYMPIVVTIAMIGALIFYIMYIFPKMTSLLTKYDIEIPPMTKATLDLSNFLQNNVILILAGFVLPIFAFIYWMRTEKGRYIIDRTLIRIPYFGSVLHKNCIEIFSRVFYALYSSSGENIQAIRIAAESCNNKFIERQIVNTVIPRMLKEGKSFVECIAQTNCFTINAIRRFRSGEESGTLRESARQLADYYEMESGHKMKRMVDSINLIISIVVSLMIIGLTLISSEIGFVSPTSPLSRTHESSR